MTENELIEKIASFEGFRNSVYKDAAGVPTIGYGFTDKKLIARGYLSQYESKEILRELVLDKMKIVSDYMTIHEYKITPNQLYALTDFTYNCGITNLMKLCDNGKRDLNTIRSKILLYNKAGGKVLSGLKKRRQWEYDLFGEVCQDIQIKKHTIKELQALANVKAIKHNLKVDNLVIDGIMGSRSIEVLYQLISLL